MNQENEQDVKRCPVCNDPLPVNLEGEYVEHKDCQVNELGNVVVKD